MSRYIVQPMLGARGVPYYVVMDTATEHGVEGYGCELWARHRADDLNRKAGDRRPTSEQKGGQNRV